MSSKDIKYSSDKYNNSYNDRKDKSRDDRSKDSKGFKSNNTNNKCSKCGIDGKCTKNGSNCGKSSNW